MPEKTQETILRCAGRFIGTRGSPLEFPHMWAPHRQTVVPSHVPGLDNVPSGDLMALNTRWLLYYDHALFFFNATVDSLFASWERFEPETYLR